MTTTLFTACLAVKDITKTLNFYESLGYNVTRNSVAHPHNIHLILEGDTLLFMIQPEEEVKHFMPSLKHHPLGASGFFYITTNNFEKTVNRIRNKVEVLLETSEGGFKLFYFKDINGYIFAITEKEDA